MSIAAGGGCTVGLKADGTVVAVGANYNGQCDVSGWRNIVAVAATTGFIAGLKADGTLAIAGYDYYDSILYSFTDIAAIAGGEFNIVLLRSDGTVISQGPEGSDDYHILGMQDFVAIDAGYARVYGLTADGTVAVGGWDCDDIGASDWKDIVAIAAGSSNIVGLKSDGTVVALWDRSAWDMSALTDIRLPEK